MTLKEIWEQNGKKFPFKAAFTLGFAELHGIYTFTHVHTRYGQQIGLGYSDTTSVRASNGGFFGFESEAFVPCETHAPSNLPTPECTCSTADLVQQGCKCGYIAFERAQA